MYDCGLVLVQDEWNCCLRDLIICMEHRTDCYFLCHYESSSVVCKGRGNYVRIGEGRITIHV